MPNRIIKESICENAKIDALTPFQEVCFYRLIVNVDDYGRLDGRPAILRSRLFPLKQITDEALEAALQTLDGAGLVCRYRVDGRPYLCLPGWNQHQRVRNRRSKYPAPPGWVEPDPCPRSADDCPQVAADGGLNPIQSVSQSQSESELSSQQEKKTDGIYNDNWRWSTRARAATAQILVDQFVRDKLPCAGIRDLYDVVRYALENGNTPEDITLAAQSLPLAAFASSYMSQ